ETSVSQVQFSSDAKYLISLHKLNPGVVGGAESLRRWDLATGKEVSRFIIPKIMGPVSLSADLKTVLMSDSTGDAIFSEWATGKARATFTPPPRLPSFTPAFSPDGRQLATYSTDYTVLLWDVTGICPDGNWTPRDVSPKELTRLWADLADDDAAKA